ncbi:MAG: hypothetical protein ACT4OV_11355 [Microthrixaceae bacterium]
MSTNRGWGLGAVALCLAITGGCSGGSGGQRLDGSVLVEIDRVSLADTGVLDSERDMRQLYEDGADCPPDWVPNHVGEQVVVRDADGSTVATATLEPSTIVAKRGSFPRCELSFQLDVPSSEFYEFEVGDAGATETIQRDELEANDWRVVLVADR